MEGTRIEEMPFYLDLRAEFLDHCNNCKICTKAKEAYDPNAICDYAKSIADRCLRFMSFAEMLGAKHI